jgi:hypothetical protein
LINREMLTTPKVEDIRERVEAWENPMKRATCEEL